MKLNLRTTIKHVDEILKFLAVMTGDNRYEEILADKEGYNGLDKRNTKRY